LNCDQIRELLDDYHANQLTGFKVTWVAQHLGGCHACRTQAVRPPVVPNPMQTVELSHSKALPISTKSAARWIPVAGLALILCITLPLLLLQYLNQAEASMARPQRIVYDSPAQTQSGVTAAVVQLVRQADLFSGILRFHGQGLVPPEELENWLAVVDSKGGILSTTIQEVIAGQDLLSVRFQMVPPPVEDSFRVFLGSVWTELEEPWAVQLPRPMNGLGGGGVRLPGSPAGAQLVAYGVVGDMLVLHMRAPLPAGQLMGSRLQLIDAVGTLIAPLILQETSGPEDHTLWMQYPIPRETHPPLRIVGQRFSRKEVGPWQIPVSLSP